MSTPPAATPGWEHTQDLLRAFRDGDDAAWKEIYRRYRTFLLVSVRIRMPGFARRRFDEEDLVQSAFLKAWRSMAAFQYRGEGSFRTWMKEIVANHLRNRMRALSRERERLADSQAFEREAPGVSARDAQPDALLADLEEQERTLQAMARLEEEQQDLVTMRLFERLSWTDIGTILGCGRHTARDRYERALERLTRSL